MFTIEKGIPVPANAKPLGRRVKYPLQLLEPGESFFIPVDDAKQSKNLRSSLSVRAKKLNIKIVVIADETGVRVWRTS